MITHILNLLFNVPVYDPFTYSNKIPLGCEGKPTPYTQSFNPSNATTGDLERFHYPEFTSGDALQSNYSLNFTRLSSTEITIPRAPMPTLVSKLLDMKILPLCLCFLPRSRTYERRVLSGDSTLSFQSYLHLVVVSPESIY